MMLVKGVAEELSFRCLLAFTGGFRYPISGVWRAGQKGQRAEPTSFAFSLTGQ
jgi:hypothetical protein